MTATTTTTTTTLFQSSKPTTTTTSSSRRRRRRRTSSSLSRRRVQAFSEMGTASTTAPMMMMGRRPGQGTTFLKYSLTHHDLLTKEQELELGAAIQKSLALQAELRETIASKQAELASSNTRATEQLMESEEEWFALMGHGNSQPFASTQNLGDDDDDDDDLASLSVVDSAAWYQQAGDVNMDALLLSQRSAEERFSVEKENVQEDDVDILSDEEIQQAVGLSRIQVQSILVEGAVARDVLIRSNVRLVVDIAKKWAKQAARGTEMDMLRVYEGSWDRPSLDEAVQDGIVGLIKAADRYDPVRNLKFSTYATFWVTSQVRRCFQAAATPAVRVPYAYHDIKSKLKTLVRDYHMADEPVPPLEDLAKQIGVSLPRLQLVLRVTRTAESIDAPIGSGGIAGAGKAGNNEDTMVETLADSLMDPEVSAEDRVELSFLRQSLELAMANELSPHERDVVRLHLGLDDNVARSVAQVSREYDGLLTAHEVRAALNRAFRKLRSPNSLSLYKFLAYLDFAGIDSATAQLD